MTNSSQVEDLETEHPSSQKPRETGSLLTDKMSIIAIASAILLTFSLRYLLLSSPSQVIDFDGTYYINFAQQILNGDGLYHPIFSPGYPLLIALFHHIFDTGLEKAGEQIALIFSVLCIYPLYHISKACTSKPAALFTILFYAALPLWVEYGANVQTLTLGTFLWLMAMHACMRWQRQKSTTQLIATAIFLGMASLTRPEFLVSAIIFPAWLFIQAWRENGQKTWLVWIILPLTFAIYSPYMSAIHQATGTWKVATKSEINQSIANVVGAKDYSAAREKAAQSSATKESQGLLNFWFSSPLQTAKRIIANTYILHQYMWPKQFPVVLTLLIGIGIFIGIGKTRMGILLVATLIYLPAMTFLPDARILLPWATLFLPWAGYAATVIVKQFGKPAWPFLVAVMGLLILTATQPTRHDHPAIAIKSAALWLASHHHNEIVWARGPRVAYYSHATVKQPPASSTLSEFRKHVQGPGWLMIDNHKFPPGRQQLYAQLMGTTPGWLQLEQSFSGPDGHLVSLFRVLPETRRPE